MKKKLTKKDRDVSMAIGVKGMIKIQKVFRLLCRKCRAKVMTNPKMEIGEYCPKCKKMAERLLRGYIAK